MDKDLNKRDTMIKTLELIQSRFFNEIMVEYYDYNTNISTPRDKYILEIRSFLKVFPLNYILSDSTNEDILLMLGFKKIKIQETDETKELLNKYESIISLAESLYDSDIFDIAAIRKREIEASITAYLMPRYFKHYFSKEDSIQYYDCVIDRWVDERCELDFDDTMNHFFKDLHEDYTGYSIYAVQFKDKQ